MLSTKTVNSTDSALWLASQTLHTLCYLSLSNLLGILASKNIAVVAGPNEFKTSFCAISTHCFSIYLKNQLFTAVSVAGAKHFPPHFVAW